MADTRAKVHITVDRLEWELSELREELADLKELKQEVCQIRDEMVTMPRVEAKLIEMNLDIQKTLQLILKNMTLSSHKEEVATPSAPPPLCSGTSIPETTPVITIPDLPNPLQPQISRNLTNDFAYQGSVQFTTIPGVTTGLRNPSKYTESTRVHSEK